jgi:AmiR/NasT family two-component response regulator
MAVREDQRPPRVLLGNLEPVVRMGMATVLREDGFDIVGGDERPAALVLLAGRLRPDAVVLDIAQAASRSLGERVRGASPETTVVFWARDEEVMEVLAPGRSEARRVFAPDPEELRSAVLRSHLKRVER